MGVVGANIFYFVRRGATTRRPVVGVGEIPLLGEMSRSDKGVMAQP